MDMSFLDFLGLLDAKTANVPSPSIVKSSTSIEGPGVRIS